MTQPNPPSPICESCLTANGATPLPGELPGPVACPLCRGVVAIRQVSGELMATLLIVDRIVRYERADNGGPIVTGRMAVRMGFEAGVESVKKTPAAMPAVYVPPVGQRVRILECHPEIASPPHRPGDIVTADYGTKLPSKGLSESSGLLGWLCLHTVENKTERVLWCRVESVTAEVASG